MVMSSSSPSASLAYAFSDEVWEHVFSFVDADADRNAISLVCRGWHRIDRFCRRRIFVGNCYAVCPRAAIARFPMLRSVCIKGKPHFADFNLVPQDWGGGVYEWIAALSESCPLLEELRFKRMTVTDECLVMVATCFRNFKSLVLTSCEGFTSLGLASIASNCRNLQELDLQDNYVIDFSGHWLSCFPESFTSLVSLSLMCLEGDVNIPVLERLISRCTNLKTLRLGHSVTLDRLPSILRRAARLIELGTGKFDADPRSELYTKLDSTFAGLKSLKSFSGLSEACPVYLPTLYSVCDGLTSLNLRYANNMQRLDLIKLISRCSNLRKLWVLDNIEDDGLDVISLSCKDLQELRVFPSDPYGVGVGPPVPLTERGLVAVSAGCQKLNSVLYFCLQMTNAALITVARNRPNLIRFRLCIMEPRKPDYVTLQPLDTGFSAIVQSCSGLRRLSLSGLLTDRVFETIGAHANHLEMLSVAFAGETDAGLHSILFGCKSLRKLEIRDCPFGDKSLLANASRLEAMRSLWISSCSVSLGACKLLAQKMRRLNVEVMNERMQGSPELWPDDCLVEKLYVYRTLSGPRSDAPNFVWTL